MIASKIPCPDNPDHRTQYYDGALGFEGLICHDCRLMWNLNAPADDPPEPWPPIISELSKKEKGLMQ